MLKIAEVFQVQWLYNNDIGSTIETQDHIRLFAGDGLVYSYGLHGWRPTKAQRYIARYETLLREVGYKYKPYKIVSSQTTKTDKFISYNDWFGDAQLVHTERLMYPGLIFSTNKLWTKNMWIIRSTSFRQLLSEKKPKTNKGYQAHCL